MARRLDPNKPGYPSLLSIFLTTRCNVKCFICKRDGFRGEDMKFENLVKLEQAIRHARTVDLTGWGECLIYPRFEEVLQYIVSLNPGPEVIQFVTNGTRLSEQIARRVSGHLGLVVISLNAARAETYNQYTKGARFDDTLTHVRSFLDNLSNCDRRKVGFHFVAHTGNFREIPEFIELAARMGVVKVSVGHYLAGLTEHAAYTLLNAKEEYNAVVDRAAEMAKKMGIMVSYRRFFDESRHSVAECRTPFDVCYVDPNGNVAPCCYCGSTTMGNVYETTFETVWFGEAYRKLREKRHLPACRVCTPFIPLDDYRAHFTAHLKETSEFVQIDRVFEKSSRAA
jgi:MoaA/NifB/PqqE/SkfB family radical SAM enzyme